MRVWIAAAGLLLAALAVPAQGAETDSGAISGTREGTVTVYRGVPFAAPPVGDLRWRPPQPVKPWSGVRSADRFAPACMQTGVSMSGEAEPPISEDCLYLNIWAPAAPRGKLPVLVWIYGGGFSNGNASMPLYSGERLAQKGVIVVTVAYRVGAFGFLSHPDLSRESSHGSSGNYGLMDQIAALRWVQRNIGAFGGDPSRVTIAGQSAGAMSVSILMASPLTKGLFQRAIGQSGAFFEPVQIAPGYLFKNAEREGIAFASSLGAPSIAVLRRLPAEAILKGRQPSGAHPIVEPYVLPRPPFDVFAAGEQADVPVLIGLNAEEGRAFLDGQTIRGERFAADITARFGALPPPLLAAYPFGNDEEARRARIDFETDLRFGWGMWAWARLHAAKGKPVYSYRFTHQPPFPPQSVHRDWGAGHFAELWYVFDRLAQTPWAWRDSDRRLATTITDYWTNFVKSGSPNESNLPAWPSFASDEGPVLLLQERIAVGRVDRLNALRVFDAVYGQLRAQPLPAPPE